MTNLQLARHMTQVIFSAARLLREGWCESRSEFDRKEKSFLDALDNLELEELNAEFKQEVRSESD